MGIRDDGIPQGFRRLLRKLRPALKLEPIEIQQAIAYLVWVSPTKSRAHKELEGHMSIAYQELDKHFGRQGFKSLNDRLGIFHVTPNWWSQQRLTRGYKLKPDLDSAVSQYLNGWRKRVKKVGRALIGMDGKRLHQIPQAVASKDMKGITAKAWNRAAVKKLVPVDVPRLVRYCKTLERMIDDPQADLFIVGDVADYQYKLDVVGRIMEMAREHEGRWSVIQRYIESDSGRLYGKNINLQNVPRSVKEVALHGLWEYDFSNCHYSILAQLAASYRIECNAIEHYLSHKQGIRHQLMTDIGITKDEAKTCLISLIYGARFSHRDEDAIPAAIGKNAALRLYQHPFFIALKDDVAKARSGVISQWPRSRNRLQNAYGKWIRETEGHPQILAHLLQGVEAKMLEAVRMRYPDEILLLQHDGFASSQQLDTGKMIDAIYQRTGYRMQIEESRIALSPSLGID